MIYILYFASYLLVPLHGLFGIDVIVLFTLAFFASTYLCILYFKTGNRFTDALDASLLATIILQICCVVAHKEIVTTVNYPYHAFALFSFMGAVYALEKNTRFGIPMAVMATIVSFIGLAGILPPDVINNLISIT